MTFFDYLKNIFIVLIIIQLAPMLFEGIKNQYGRYFEPKTKVGVIKLNGLIYDSSTVVRELQSFFRDSAIKGVVLRMECQGTASGTAQAIFSEIIELKKESPKPIITLVENVCASGGYWIACATDHIIAPGSALIGSIGVTVSHMFQLQGLLEQYHIGYVPIKAGTYKLATDPFVNITDAEKEHLQKVLDDTYQQFTRAVANRRKLSINTAPDWADGKIFTGAQAHKLGLIDEIGSVHNATRVIKEKGLIEGDIEWVHKSGDRSIWSLLSGAQFDGSDDNSMVNCALNRICTFLENRYALPRTHS